MGERSEHLAFCFGSFWEEEGWAFVEYVCWSYRLGPLFLSWLGKVGGWERGQQ